MGSLKLLYVFGLFLLLEILAQPRTVMGGGSQKCAFQTVFNFGDSNSDTGQGNAAWGQVPPPNGETFFGHPAGRYSDGRLIIDFIETKNTSPSRSRFPPPREFSKALYIFDIGQNDLGYLFQHTAEEQVRNSIPDILSHLSGAVQALYKEGSRFFWVHNTGPLGCLPYNIIYNAKPGNVDQNGCVKNYNEMAQEFNRQLKDKISLLRTQLPGSAFTYVDVFAAKYQLISTAKSQGFFLDPKNFCCGSYYGYHVDCGKQTVVNGTVYGGSCRDPSTYISWDGIHYTEAANHWVANHILNGSLSDPPFAVDEACRHP